MRRSSLLLPLAAAAAILTTAVPAQAADLLGDPSARLFTVADAPGAKIYESEGVVATGRRVVVASLGALPSGDLVFADDHNFKKAKLWRIDAQGVLRELPGGKDAAVLAVEPGGTILVGLSDSHRVVRVSADGATATPVVDLGTQPGAASGELVGLAPLPGGGFAAADTTHVWKVDAGGTVTSLAPGATNIDALAAATDGTIVFRQGSDDKLRRIPAGGGAPTVISETRAGSDVALAPLPDGRMLMSVTGFLDDPSGTLETLDPTSGARTVVAGTAPAFGLGDGGPLAGVAASAIALTATPDGGIAFAQRAAQEDTPLRRLAPAASPQALGTFAQEAYGQAAGSHTAVVTTRPGTATVEVRSVASGKLIRTVTGPVTAGTTSFAFTPALPATDLTQTLRFTPTGAAAPVTATISVSTRTSIKLAAVYKVLDTRFAMEGGGDDEDGYGTERGRCFRLSLKRVDCQVRNYEVHYKPHHKTSKCVQTVRVRQRADGINLQFVDGCKK
jgi:hypothetical protein